MVGGERRSAKPIHQSGGLMDARDRAGRPRWGGLRRARAYALSSPVHGGGGPEGTRGDQRQRPPPPPASQAPPPQAGEETPMTALHLSSPAPVLMKIRKSWGPQPRNAALHDLWIPASAGKEREESLAPRSRQALQVAQPVSPPACGGSVPKGRGGDQHQRLPPPSRIKSGTPPPQAGEDTPMTALHLFPGEGRDPGIPERPRRRERAWGRQAPGSHPAPNLIPNHKQTIPDLIRDPSAPAPDLGSRLRRDDEWA